MTTTKKTKPEKTKVVKKKSSPKKPVEKTNPAKPKKTKKQILILDAVLVINNAKALSQDFEKLIKNDNDITVDASAVEMIDTAILQLLLTITIKVESSNHQVHWINPSTKFISNASLLGLSKSFGLA